MGFSVIYNIRDGKNKKSAMMIHLPSSVDPDNLAGFASSMAILIKAIITGAIESIGVSLSVDVPLLAQGAADPDSDVEEGARFQFVTDGGHFTRMRVPTFNEEFISPESSAVDTAAATVVAFLNGIESGLTVSGTNVSPSDSRDEDIVDHTTANEAFMASRGA